MNYLYYNFYRWYYEKKLSGMKITSPEGWAAFIFGVGGGLLTMLLTLIYLQIVHGLISGDTFVIINTVTTFIVAGIVNWYYTNNLRYIKIYQEYNKRQSEKNKQHGAFISFFIVVGLPFILIIAYMILTKKLPAVLNN